MCILRSPLIAKINRNMIPSLTGSTLCPTHISYIDPVAAEVFRLIISYSMEYLSTILISFTPPNDVFS